jgi:ribosomal 50S subunit-associated protein YjgA (DUF615 family)
MTAIDVNNLRDKLDNSRRRAAQFMAMAERATDPAAKAEALDLAETWRSVAERAEKLLYQLENVSEPILPEVFSSRENSDASLGERITLAA